MAYADLLWDNSEKVIRQGYMHTQMYQDFMLAINNRIQIEEHYSTQLKSLSLYLDKHLNKEHKDRSSIIFVISAFKSDLVRRENQTVAFVGHLKEEVLKLLTEYHDNQVVQARVTQKQIMIIQASFIEMKKKMEAVKVKLSELDKARQQQFVKLQVLKVRSFIPNQQREKQTSRARYVQKQYKQYDVIYRSVMKDYNSFIADYLQSIQHYVKIFQTHQQGRINKMMDSMKKILVFQSAMMRNFQYDITNITNQLHSLQIGRDIKEFAEKYSKGNKKPSAEAVPKLNLRSTVIYDMLIRKLDDRLHFQSEQIMKLIKIKMKKQSTQKQKSPQQQVQKEEEPQNQYQCIRAFVVQPNSIELQKPRLLELLDKDQNRNYLQLYAKWYCEQHNYQTDQHIKAILQILIQKCVTKRDVFCLRRILTLIFTQFNLKSAKGKKLFYLDLYKLSIWRSSDFWEASMFEAVQQKLKASIPQKGETKQDAKTRQKMVILNQLADYCNMMVMMNFNMKTLKLLAGKFLRMYGLGESESKHLLTIIGDSELAFKEIWSRSSKDQQSQKTQQTK